MPKSLDSKAALSIAVVAAFVLLAVVPSLASAQASRTWVSGVGDDVNPCSRTAPCKTFAGAISKTAAEGEINCLDPGGFGTVTIVKAITLDCRSSHGGVLASLSNGVVVNAPSTARVNLLGLRINGTGDGFSGIRILAAKKVRVADTDVYGFTGGGGRAGISFAPSTATTLNVRNSSVFDNAGPGMLVQPSGSGSAKATVRSSDFEANNEGIVAFGPALAAWVRLFDSSVLENTTNGIRSDGASAAFWLGNDVIFGNGTGLAAAAGGQILSYGNNYVGNNTVDGNPTATIPQK